jgi:hypothetical protein
VPSRAQGVVDFVTYAGFDAAVLWLESSTQRGGLATNRPLRLDVGYHAEVGVIYML